MEKKKIDTFYTKNIICPYCGYEDTDSHEMEGEEAGWNDGLEKISGYISAFRY